MTTKIDDGGSAFPCPTVIHDNGQREVGTWGMSLRDWFAGQVLGSMDLSNTDISAFSDGDLRAMAGQVYRISDAMLVARKGAA